MRISDWSSDVCSSDLKDRAIGSLFLRLLLKAQWLLLHRQSQDRGALEQGQLRGVARGFLRHLDTACPGSDNCHPLSGERKSALRPVRGMVPFACKRLKADNVRSIGFGGEASASSEARRVGKECVSTCRSRWS